jgi:hypothetical protein
MGSCKNTASLQQSSLLACRDQLQYIGAHNKSGAIADSAFSYFLLLVVPTDKLKVLRL